MSDKFVEIDDLREDADELRRKEPTTRSMITIEERKSSIYGFLSLSIIFVFVFFFIKFKQILNLL